MIEGSSSQSDEFFFPTYVWHSCKHTCSPTRVEAAGWKHLLWTDAFPCDWSWSHLLHMSWNLHLTLTAVCVLDLSFFAVQIFLFSSCPAASSSSSRISTLPPLHVSKPPQPLTLSCSSDGLISHPNDVSCVFTLSPVNVINLRLSHIPLLPRTQTLFPLPFKQREWKPAQSDHTGIQVDTEAMMLRLPPEDQAAGSACTQL